MTQDDKITRAKELRDAALTILRAAGTWEAGGPPERLSTQSGAVTIVYRTPVQSVPEPSECILRSNGTLIGRSVWRNRLPFGVDIISAPKKVLCIEWDDGGAVFLDTFWPGPWEAEVIAAAQRDTP